MKSTQIALAILAAASIAFAQAQTNVYKWTDKDGKVHFSDVPPDDKDATQKTMGGGDPENAQLPYAAQVAAQRYPVTIFAAANCDDCDKGRKLLETRGVPYTERDAQASAADQDALKKLVGALYVPALAIGDKALKGFREDEWNAALDSAGYPRTRLPGPGSMRKNPMPPQAQPPEAATK